MPIYEYQCSTCNNTFTLLQKMGTSEKDTVCQQCGSRDVKKDSLPSVASHLVEACHLPLKSLHIVAAPEGSPPAEP